MQVLMFSATLHSQEVKDVAAKICQQPIVVDLKVWHKNKYSPGLTISTPATHTCFLSSCCDLNPAACIKLFSIA